MPAAGQRGFGFDAGFRVDPSLWPHVATVPNSFKASWGSRRAEAEFAAACDKAGLSLSGPDADLEVLEENLFPRLAVAGWLGLAESFMAGEWRSPRIADVLTRLLEAGYDPKARRDEESTRYTGLELPPQLVRLFSGDGMSASGTIFASGVPTTQRNSVRSYVRGAGRNNEPATHFVDETRLGAPAVVERADLRDAQLRALGRLLELAGVDTGTHLLDFPASGAAALIAGASKGAIVDALSADMELIGDIREVLKAAGMGENVHVELTDDPIPGPKDWQRNYDSILSVEKLEAMGPRAARAYAKKLDRMLRPGGYIGMQTVVKTNARSEAVDRASGAARAYLFPALDYFSVEGIHKLFDEHTGLRVIGAVHFGGHYRRGLALQRETFEGRTREAAADGFDAVYRRMWVFTLAIKEALFRAGALDAVQLTLTTRNRRGLR